MALVGLTCNESVRDGNLNDLKDGVALISSRIPEKSDLSLEEVLRRLDGKDYHIRVISNEDKLEGIHIWYGPYRNPDDCYLWLGAVADSGHKRGSLLMADTLKDMVRLGYKVSYAKTKSSNILARAVLEKFGFNVSESDKELLMYAKRL